MVYHDSLCVFSDSVGGAQTSATSLSTDWVVSALSTKQDIVTLLTASGNVKHTLKKTHRNQFHSFFCLSSYSYLGPSVPRRNLAFCINKKPILHSLVPRREEMQETQHAPLRDHSRLPNTCQSGGALLIITPTQLPTEPNAQPSAPPHTCTRHTRTHKASSQGLSTGSWWPFSAYDLHGFPVRLLSSGESLCTAKPPNITVKILSPLIVRLKYRCFFLHKHLRPFSYRRCSDN